MEPPVAAPCQGEKMEQLTQERLRNELKAMIADLLEIKTFDDDAHFIRDLRADSMLLVELVVRVEKRYQVKLPEAELRNIRSLTDMLRVTSKLLNLNA
jgi:acyl carrier protein